MKKLNILVVEDGKSQREILRDFLKGEGHAVMEAANGETALQLVQNHLFDLLLLDLRMPGMDGMDVLKAVKAINPEIDVVILTAHGTIETAVEAMKAGALDYIMKPLEFDELLIQVDRVAERRNLIRENELLREELHDKSIITDQIIYRSSQMQEMINMAGRVANSRATVLLQGESGTGKELLARFIHQLSPRSKERFISVHCSDFLEINLEIELFGHERDSSKGISKRRIGRIEEADGGTLLLKEITEITRPSLGKLLHFLQEHEFQRVGGSQTIHSDVRIISATNRDLQARVREGFFREDLFYRLNVVVMNLPPLRERKDDIPPLIDHFLKRFTADNGKKIDGLSSEARDLLLKYDYPGNVRELENIIERAVVIAREETISIEDLPFHADSIGYEDVETGLLKKSVDEMEKKLIQYAMEDAGHNQTTASESLGISERMLRYKLKKLGLKE